MRHAAYNTYFRTLASQHTDIRHSATQMHFARIIRSTDPFAKLDLTEFLTSIKSRMKLPFMLLETFDAKLEDNRSDNKWKLHMGAFIILDKAEKGNPDDIESKLDSTEQIAEDLLARMYEDYKKRRVDWHLDLNDVTVEKVGPISDNLYGTRVDFLLKTTANQILVYNPSKFII